MRRFCRVGGSDEANKACGPESKTAPKPEGTRKHELTGLSKIFRFPPILRMWRIQHCWGKEAHEEHERRKQNRNTGSDQEHLRQKGTGRHSTHWFPGPVKPGNNALRKLPHMIVNRDSKKQERQCKDETGERFFHFSFSSSFSLSVMSPFPSVSNHS